MDGRRVLLYFAWSRPAEISAPLFDIDNRFPAIFELRRLFYPKFEAMSDPDGFDQGIAGFLDYVQKANFKAFAEEAKELTGHEVTQVERVVDDVLTPLSASLAGVDTVVVISFDSLRTAQIATAPEIEAIRHFLEDPDHLIFVCPHHDIGDSSTPEQRAGSQLAEYRHHGDPAIPPRQGFGGFARSLMAGLGVPVENRFGLRPATEPDGAPSLAVIHRDVDSLGLLRDVDALNAHPHLPHFERIGTSSERLDVLAEQRIDMSAPPHSFTDAGRQCFDAVLQSRPTTFKGTLLVSDTTLFSSTAGGVRNLRRLWANVVQRPKRL